MTLLFGATLIVLSFGGAFVSGLLGVGGAIVMIPLLFYVPPLLSVGQLDIKTVAAVTMVQVFAASVMGAWGHSRQAMVHRKLALVGGGTMALGSLLGAVGSKFVEGRVLLSVFAVMTTVALPLMFLPPPVVDDSDPRRVTFSLAGAALYPGVIGGMAGLVGAGGAFLLMPVLTGFLHIPMRLAIGTSLAITTVSAFTGFIGKLVTAQIPFWPALTVLVGALAGSQVGVRVSHRAGVQMLRRLLAGIIGLTALRVWVDVLFP